MEKFLRLLTLPFYKHISLFLLVLLLNSSLEFYDHLIVLDGNLDGALVLLSWNFLESYIFVWIYSFLPKKWSRFYLGLLLITLVLFFVIDQICIFKFYRSFDLEVLSVILGTNLSEAWEFFLFYINYDIILMVLSLIIVVSFFGKLSKRKSVLSKRYITLFPVLLVGALVLNIYSCLAKKSGYDATLCSKVYILFSTPAVEDLKNYYGKSSSQIEQVTSSPQNLVIIIGESFARKHSSLYGYSKETNPRLDSLKNEGLLFAFENVESSATSTVPSFKSFMSLYRTEYGESKNWYEFTTIPEYVKNAGYRSMWISNQSAAGLHDNVPASYARLCNKVIFTGSHSFDECVLSQLPPLESLDSMKNVTFVHLMGSHSAYSERYPITFNKFSEQDYGDHPQHQRLRLAQYDNSVLYNDSVVFEIIDHFSTTESVVVYFSDHGLDLYESSDDFCGQAIPRNPRSLKAGRQIPFIIYMSPKYKQKYPQMVERIQCNIEKPYLIDDLPYTVLDLMGTKLKGNEDVRHHSILCN